MKGKMHEFEPFCLVVYGGEPMLYLGRCKQEFRYGPGDDYQCSVGDPMVLRFEEDRDGTLITWNGSYYTDDMWAPWMEWK